MRDGKPPWKLDIGLDALGTHSGPRAPSLSPPQVPMAPGSAELHTKTQRSGGHQCVGKGLTSPPHPDQHAIHAAS